MSAPPHPVNTTRSLSLYAAVSALLVLPNFWHHHIQAGDLGSHTYNAWLAQLVQQHQAPGLYLATQWQNVLFDLILFYLCKLFGFTLGEKLSVSICVLIFFWGVFALIEAATKRSPWFLSPLIAMTAYGYVFHMGFMNYYLSLGIASFALALVWNGQAKGMTGAAVLSAFIVLAHPLGILWFLGAGLYRFLCLHTKRVLRVSLPVLGIAALAAIRFYLLHHPGYQADWADGPFYQWNGSDQFRIFGDAYDYLSYAMVLLALAFVVLELFRRETGTTGWKDRRLLSEFYLLSFCAVVLLPEDLRPDPQGSWIGGLATRLTLICTIFAICFLASLKPSVLHLAAFGACAMLFFFLLYRDTGVLDRSEQNAEAILNPLPFGTRVASTVHTPPEYRTQFEHLVDRACINHCFLYSNYEPSTQKFRVRVQPSGSRIVASTVDESEDLQSGNYEVEEADLPLKQIYQCDSADLTRLCIRDLTAGETNGRLGYRPQP